MASGKALVGPRLKWIPLAEISAHPSIREDTESAVIEDLGVTDAALRVLCTIRPLVVIPVGVGQYQAISGARILGWHLNAARCTGNHDSEVLALIIPAEGVDVEFYRLIDRHLAPLILGELATRPARVARRALKLSGDRRLKPIPLLNMRPIER